MWKSESEMKLRNEGYPTLQAGISYPADALYYAFCEYHSHYHDDYYHCYCQDANFHHLLTTNTTKYSRLDYLLTCANSVQPASY